MSSHALSGRRVLVTGGAGFIGSHVCRRLLAVGADVYATSRDGSSGIDDVHWLQGDLADLSATRAAVTASRPDVVLHLAGRVHGGRELEFVGTTLRDTLIGTVNLLTAVSETGTGRVVLAGSMEEPSAAEVDRPPASPYAAAKQAASVYARLFRSLYRLPVVSLRVFMVYGPGQQEPWLVPYVVGSLLRGEQPRLTSGTREIDWVFVEDVVEAFVAAASAEGVDGPLDIGSGTMVTIRELVDTIVAKVRPDVDPAFGALPDRPFETSNAAAIARTEELLGWRPTTTLDEGLDRTIEWLAERSGILRVSATAH